MGCQGTSCRFEVKRGRLVCLAHPYEDEAVNLQAMRREELRHLPLLPFEAASGEKAADGPFHALVDARQYTGWSGILRHQNGEHSTAGKIRSGKADMHGRSLSIKLSSSPHVAQRGLDHSSGRNQPLKGLMWSQASSALTMSSHIFLASASNIMVWSM